MIKAYSYIRFSTPDQIKGDSLRRQLEASERYAKENNLDLDSTLRDYGLSGFDGSNRRKGALKDFINLIESGKIESGSYLLIENLDRLSREKPLDALDQFRKIIEAGITIVTLGDHREYTRDSINNNIGELYIIVGEIQRAHSESKRKSEMVGKAWQKNRENAAQGGRKLTGRCPLWLKLSKDKTVFEPIPEIVEAVQEIFRLKIENRFGRVRITRIMNEGNFWKPPKGTRNKIGGWQHSYITKILGNRAVFGEFQPHIRKDGKRIPTGEVWENYYPTIIEEKTWLLAQEVAKENGEKVGNTGGKTGKANNLFQHIARCGLCGSPMQFIDKGKPPKGAKYLRCSSARFNRGCTAKLVRYDEFEKLFFNRQVDIDFSQLLPTDSKNVQLKRIKEIEEKVLSNNILIPQKEKELDNIQEGFAGATDERVRNRLESMLAKREDEIEALNKENKQLAREKEALNKDSKTLQLIKSNANRMYEMLQDIKDTQESIKIRSRINAELKKYINLIEIFPRQSIDEEIEWTQSQYELNKNDNEGKSSKYGSAILNSWVSDLNRLRDIKANPGSYHYLSDSMRLIRIDFKSLIKFPVQTLSLREPANMENE